MTRGSGGTKQQRQRGQPASGREHAQQGISRRGIILAEAAALFADRGVAATTVRQIADGAGVLSGSLYHHFGSKEEIAQEVVITYLDDLRDRCRALRQRDLGPRDRLRSLVLVSLEAVADYPYAVAIYQNEPAVLRSVPRQAHITAAAGEIDQFWVDVITAGVDSGQIRSDVGPRLLRRLLRDAVWLSPRWYRPSPGYPPARLTDELLTVFLDGCSAQDRRHLAGQAPSG
jgi:AcrR family transcriptional regulator